jgi:hypothetical protein
LIAQHLSLYLFFTQEETLILRFCFSDTQSDWNLGQLRPLSVVAQLHFLYLDFFPSFNICFSSVVESVVHCESGISGSILLEGNFLLSSRYLILWKPGRSHLWANTVQSFLPVPVWPLTLINY